MKYYIVNVRGNIGIMPNDDMLCDYLTYTHNNTRVHISLDDCVAIVKELVAYGLLYNVTWR